MSDIARLLPRCPRCGYGLRFVRGYWWCDVCRVSLIPQKGSSVRDVFRLAGESLRRFLARPSQNRATLTYPRALSGFERGPSLVRCPSCGALTPREHASCVHCGTTFGHPAEIARPKVAATSQVSERDDLVYRYIVGNEGEISLVKASADLNMTLPELQASIRRLEDTKRITRERSRANEQGAG